MKLKLNLQGCRFNHRLMFVEENIWITWTALIKINKNLMKGVFKIIFKCMKEIQRRLFHFREPKRTACTNLAPGASKFKVFFGDINE